MKPRSDPRIYRFGDFVLDVARRELRRGDRVIELPPRSFDVLVYLIEHRERVVSQDELLRKVWRVKALSDSSVPTALQEIRRGLQDDAQRPRYIQTVRRQGYRFIAEVYVGAGAPEPGDLFVGREREMEALEHALLSARDGLSPVALVMGEAGIGKTRLLEEFARRAAERGACVLVGRCIEHEGAPPFWPWSQALRSFHAERPRLVREALGPQAPILATLVPELLASAPPAAGNAQDSATDRLRLFEAMAHFLKRAGARGPLVLVLDDIHRADLDSLALLAFVTREIRDAPLLCVCSYREPSVNADPARKDALAAVASGPGARPVPLEGLSRESVAKLVAPLPDLEASEDFVDALHARTGGNPFFLSQILHAMKVRPSESVQDALALALPDAVRDAVLRRLDAAPEATLRALAVASVLGREFPVTLLAQVLDRPVSEVTHSLGFAVQARVLAPAPSPAPAGRFRFTHILMRDVIYGEMEVMERAELHLRAAELLEGLHGEFLGPHATEIAHHLRMAIPAGAGLKAIEASIDAGHWSLSRFAYEEAIQHYRESLDNLDLVQPQDGRLRAEILLFLGEAAMRAGRREEARQALGEAARLSRLERMPEVLARAALALAPGFFAIEIGVVDQGLIALLEEAIAALPANALALRAQLMARLGQALAYADTRDRVGRLTLEALDLARRSGDEATLMHAMSARYATLSGRDDAHARLAAAADVVRLALRHGEPELALVYRIFEITDFLELGDVAAAERSIDAFSQLAIELDLPQSRWYADVHQFLRHHLRGALVDAEAALHRLMERGQQVSDRNAILSFAAGFASLLIERRRFAEVAPLLDSMRAEFPVLANAWRCASAYGFAENGHRQAALHHVEAVDPLALAQDPAWMCSITTLATAVSWLGERQRVEALFGMIEPYRDRMVVVGYGVFCMGSVARSLGLLAATLGWWDRAEALFQEALVANQRLGAAIFVPHTLYGHARMLAARDRGDDRERAKELAARALTASEPLGLANLVFLSKDLLGDLFADRPVRFSFLEA